MPSDPFARLHRDDDDLCCFASLPAFKVFGKRYAQIERRYEAAVAAEFPAVVVQAKSAFKTEELRAKVREIDSRLDAMKLEDPEWWAVFLPMLQGKGPDRPSTEPSEKPVAPPTPRGKVVVCLGEVRQPTANQRRQFDWLIANQAAVARDFRQKLYADYDELTGSQSSEESRGAESIACPKIVRGNELDSRIRLTVVRLAARREAIGLEFTCLWDEEHGLGALLSRGTVRELGGADVSYVDM